MTCEEAHEHVVHTTHGYYRYVYTICIHMLECISVRITFHHVQIVTNMFPLGGARVHIGHIHK